MKAMDILCSSQASTAICLSMDQALSSSNCSSSNSIQLGSRAIDRHNPIIKDPSRFPSKVLTNPSSSSSHHSRPYPYDHRQKTKKSSSSKPKDLHNKSSTKSQDQKNQTSSEKLNVNYSSNPINSILKRSWVRVRAPADSTTTPSGSSRYLLSDADDYKPVLALPSTDDNKAQVVQDENNSTASKPSASSDQVVVLRVSLHCKGCVGKVRKHLSRMDGVSSFSIDLAAQKVTIVGDVTPLNMLASVSKVKNAQFWPSSASAPASAQQIDVASLKQRQEVWSSS